MPGDSKFQSRVARYVVSDRLGFRDTPGIQAATLTLQNVRTGTPSKWQLLPKSYDALSENPCRRSSVAPPDRGRESYFPLLRATCVRWMPEWLAVLVPESWRRYVEVLDALR